MKRNEILARVRQMVLEGLISYDQVCGMSTTEICELLGCDILKEQEIVCIRNHAFRAGQIHENNRPLREMQCQLEGGGRTWFRQNYPDAVMSVQGGVVAMNLTGVNEEGH